MRSAQDQRLGGELHARERAFEFVRHRRQKILLPAPELRVVAQRSRQDGHASEQHDDEKSALPEIAIATAFAFGPDQLERFRGRRLAG
jgi:hypothetical protein